MKNAYVSNRLSPIRRNSIQVTVGNDSIGGGSPVLVQSMTTTPSSDPKATAAQVLDLWRAGCSLVRITIPTVKDAKTLEETMRLVREAGCEIPVSADIHFQPKAAYEAVKWVEKVRINPGNFVDKGIKNLREFSEEEFQQGRVLAKDALKPLLDAAKERGVALRIGVNHGSLSARMLNKFGDTIEGMVESALEYITLCEEEEFDQIVVSLKASSAKIVVTAYRLLVSRLKEAGMKEYPLHVGVTEAGEGQDGRVKSSVGIGALLLDGLGDTVRVSLTENPVNEVPVAETLVEVCQLNGIDTAIEWQKDPYHYQRRESAEINVGEHSLGGSNQILVGVNASLSDETGRSPEFSIEELSLPEQQIETVSELLALESDQVGSSIWSYIGKENPVSAYRAIAGYLENHNRKDPILLRMATGESERDRLLVAAQLGSLLIDGLGDAVLLNLGNDIKASVEYSFDVLQAAGMRRTKTEFISCPGCGRTLFELEETNKRVKARTSHLKDVAIAVMGCIVNGPGEMADADFGYVGAGPGKINLYVGQEVVKKGIDTEGAVDELITLIKDHGRWVEP
ncbi:MAG: (E)-4-hydroxy-3-methylbut-2-enyl-diphosphate synthase [Fibrobacterales bacterium]